MKVKIYYFIFFASVLLSSCSTDLDVTGKYKEKMVIYGLLDQSQTKQYIKVNKAFLGEGDAYTFAKVKDSTQYVNSLSVVVKRIKNGNTLSSYNFTPDSSIPKEQGIFYAPDQTNAIYSYSIPASELTTDCEYHLDVRNGESGLQASGSTFLVSNATFTTPNPNSPPTSPFTFIQATNDQYKVKFEWLSGKGAAIYQLIIRFNYIDSTSISGHVAKSLDWIFPTQKPQNTNGLETMTLSFLGTDFLRYVNNQLQTYPELIARKAGKVDLLLVSGGQDLSTFIEVNQPSTGIIQEKPKFTNITNGLGIFSARNNQPAVSKFLNADAINALSCGYNYNGVLINTRPLKFLNTNGIICP